MDISGRRQAVLQVECILALFCFFPRLKLYLEARTRIDGSTSVIVSIGSTVVKMKN